MTRRADCQAAVDTVFGLFGGIDGLFCNAGITQRSAFSKDTTEKWAGCLARPIFSLYLTHGPFGSTRASGRPMDGLFNCFDAHRATQSKDFHLKNMKLAVILALVLIPATLLAKIEVERTLKADIPAPILDVTTHPEEDMVFILTPGAVLVYSTADQAVLDRIPLEASFDRIAYHSDDRLILTSTEPSRFHILRFSRIYDIDRSGRSVKGPPGAKVALVVFDDYQ